MTKKLQPRKIIMNYDMTAGWFQVQVHGMGGDFYQVPQSMKIQKDPDAETIKRMFEDIVDEHAEAQIDAVVHCVWTSFQTWMPNCKSSRSSRGDNWDTAPNRLREAGYDMIQVILDRSRQRKVQFLAGLRMNDRHGIAQKRKFYLDHPEWRLEGYPGGLDYKYEGVRNAVLDFIEEFLAAYDVDGIEFDYMRWCHVFRPSEAARNTHLLTDFTRKARKLLDEAARRLGRDRLLLGVRVPQTIAECKMLGFDVAAWAKGGLIDYVCPSDFFYTDFNTRTEDFVSLAKGTDCKVYPSVHPLISKDNDKQLLTAAHYRAAAKNFYAYGADGISPYNYQYHWQGMIHPDYPGQPQMWPKALSYLTEVRDEKLIAKADRHYLYHPLWSGGCPTGVAKNYRIVLNRGSAKPQGTLRFRLAEDLTEVGLSAVLEFKVVGMVERDELRVRINGQEIPADQIRRSYNADGQSDKEGRPLPRFYLYQMDLGCPPARFGDNQLSVRLAKSAGKKELDLQELQVKVSAR